MSEIIMNQETLEPQVPSVLPLLALRDVVVYPHMQIALFVGREKSINAVDVARNSDNLVFVVAQKILFQKKLITTTYINTVLSRRLCKL
jgi:ATP-dependent Lon protease